MFKVIRSHLFLLVLLFPLCIHAQNFGGGPSGVKWRQFNTAKSRVIFPAGLDSQALRISNIVALLDTVNAYSLGNRIRKWNIVLHTQTTISNAYVRLAPVISEFYMMPPQNNFDEGSIRWGDNLVVHENRHMQQLSSCNKGLTKVFSFFLGQEGQLLANGLVIPNHFFEGDAVWQETLVTAQGRGRFPQFYNGFKSLWLENKNYSWMKLRSGSYKDYIPDHYPTGYMLVAYGNATYGEDFWKKVTQDAVRFKGVFYPFNKAIQLYSGKTYKQFRNDAMAFFKARSFPANSVGSDPKNYITKTQKNNVVDYLLPTYIGDDSILVTKSSYRSVSAFYLLIKGKEKKIRVMNTTLDNYYSYNNGKIVYASYQSDPRWGNRDYSVLQMVDIKTGKQKQLTYKSKYFSPDINKDATEIIAVAMNPDGTNNLHRLNANTGAIISKLPNPANYFFTQTKYINPNEAVSVIRTLGGKIALVKVDLNNGNTENITPFTFNVQGFPFVKNDTVYFNCMNGYADKVFAVSLSNKKIKQATNNNNGIYYPVVNSRGEMLVSAFTAGGSMIMKIDKSSRLWQEIAENDFVQVTDIYTPAALKGRGAGTLYNLKDEQQRSTSYKKYFHLFNFHSWRPVVADPEFGYTIYGDNLLGSSSTSLTYTYNRNEKSHTIGFGGLYAGWFPVISLGVEGSFNRNVELIKAITDTTVIIPFNFNSAKLNVGISVPLSFIGGRTNKHFNIGASYNAEQLYYNGIGKNIFTNEPLHYLSSFLSFSNVSRQARQNVNPGWAQTITASYRHAFNYRDSRKFVGSAALYFPGLSKNHSLVLQAAFQKRDTLLDLFSNTFSYSRGYNALSTRRMYKLGVNYQLPILYPDLGFGNIIFFQRIRANGFFDYTNAHARFFGDKPTDKINRSTGAEIFFDTKIWNALPVTFIVRFSYLLDINLVNPGLKNRWEFILPLGFIPN